MKTDTCCLLFLCKCYLEDTVFTRQMANFSALTSFLQCSRVRVMSCPQSQVLIAVKCSETKVASLHIIHAKAVTGCVSPSWLPPRPWGGQYLVGLGGRPASFSASTCQAERRPLLRLAAPGLHVLRAPCLSAGINMHFLHGSSRSDGLLASG